VFCAPSTGAESSGIVLLEAMGCGRPVVCSDIAGYREVVRHGLKHCSCRRPIRRRCVPPVFDGPRDSIGR
jgi:glycosyltransferase involved in cell wall biosynthesis